MAAEPSNASEIAFDFGISPTITVMPNIDVVIPAAIINRGSDSLLFGCALVPCGGLDFGAGLSNGPGEGLNALQFTFFDPEAIAFYQQFVGLVLLPNQRFDFLFGKMNFDPSIVLGNPSGTILHPTFDFRIDNAFSYIPVVIQVGEQTTFAPLEFQPSESVVPEPNSLVLLGTAGFGLLYKMRRRRKQDARSI
jgi:hypothetical protein